MQEDGAMQVKYLYAGTELGRAVDVLDMFDRVWAEETNWAETLSDLLNGHLHIMAGFFADKACCAITFKIGDSSDSDLIVEIDDYVTDFFKHCSREQDACREACAGKTAAEVLWGHFLAYLNDLHPDRKLMIGLEVAQDNDRAIELYNSFGFKVVNTYKHYYGFNEHAYRMEMP